MLKKIVISGMFLISIISNASWWGKMSGDRRAGIVIGTMLLAHNYYHQANQAQQEREIYEEVETKIHREKEEKENTAYIIPAGNPNKPIEEIKRGEYYPNSEEITNNKNVNTSIIKLNDGRVLIINYE